MNNNQELNVLQKFGYGLFVLTAKDGEKDNGCIVDAAMQIGVAPNIIMVSAIKGNLTHDMIKKTGVFNLSFLTEETPMRVFEHFGFQSGRKTDKFENCTEIKRSENGLIYIPKFTNAFLSAKVISEKELSSHTVFFAEVTETEVLSDRPSITYAYYQKNVKPQPVAAEIKGGNGKMKKYVCSVCGYVYDEEKGDPDKGIAPGTKFEDLPDDFECPLCGVGKDLFEVQ